MLRDIRKQVNGTERHQSPLRFPTEVGIGIIAQSFADRDAVRPKVTSYKSLRSIFTSKIGEDVQFD